MSIPPTNATSSSTITSFSWWQCSARERASHAARTFVPRVSSSRAARAVARSGANVCAGAPAHIRTRTGTRSAVSASNSRRRTGGSARVTGKWGVIDQPAMWT